MRFFDTKQFVEIAKISRVTMIKWQRLGLLAKRKLGQSYYFIQEDIDNIPNIRGVMREHEKNGWKNRKDLKLKRGIDK